MARALFVMIQDALAPLQISPGAILENLEAYASCLATFTAITPAHPENRVPGGYGGYGSYAVSHLTSKVLGSRIGHSGGGCFRGGGGRRWEGGGCI